MTQLANITDQARGLQRLASQFVPTVSGLAEHLTANPTHIVIAVERHDKDDPRWKRSLPTDRFLWFKTKPTVKISRIQESYGNQYDNQASFSLRFDDTLLDVSTRVGDIDHFQSRLVVLTAVQQHPVQSAAQLPAKPSSFSNTAGEQSLRQPLRTISQPNSLPPTLPDEIAMRSTWDFGNLDNSNSDPSNHVGGTDLEPKAMITSVDGHTVQPETLLPIVKSEHKLPEHNQIAPQIVTDKPESQEYQPRDIDYDPFAGQEDETEIMVRGHSLRALAQDVMPERLEAGVREGLNALAKIAKPLEQLRGEDDAQNWLRQIEKIRREAIKTRTVVGVVGNTGAGKSSVINAMLDEERLVPTNCMRACTAVVTEMSYNDSTSETSRYRAEIEFIKPEDWRKELDVLFQEVIDEDGRISHEISNPDSQAGIAYAKIRAVYHTYTKEMLTQTTVDSLMRVKHVNNILGTTKKVISERPEVFYKTLQKYVDSKEKGTEKLDKNGKKITNPKREFEHWPLIKVVKIYTKSDALSTGAVIVDLPGVHDSNAARAAVAEGYMKQCTGLWIVAPINRAVDDKAAKTLLGNTFKRQLKYDGTYSAVTFICSKTDDISRIEATDSLRLNAEMEELDQELDDVERQRRIVQKKLKSTRDQKQDHSDAIDAIEEQLEKWEELKEKLEDGKTVYAPSTPKKKTKKRKRLSNSPATRKRVRRDSTGDDEDDVSSVDSDIDEQDASSDEMASREPLTEAEIDRKIKELQLIKKDSRREKGSFDEQIRELRKQVQEFEEKESKLDERRSELCIVGRNEYSRTAIRQDFAAGIRELDQENAEEEDPDNFDPDKDLRDYDEVERSLPVFCVSSRAYQKLCGRMQKDNDVAGFTNTDQTEIPQLQAHCKALTEKGRLAACRRFLNSLDQLITSLGLWASDDGTGAKLTDKQRNAEAQFLDRKLKELEKALQKIVVDQLSDIKETLNEQLFDKFRPAIAAAAREALPTSSRWSAPRAEGGLHFMTYRATVRRNGVYAGASGHQDFNQQLFDPVQKQLATGWEKAFHRRLPHILQTFTKIASELIKKFHGAIEARCRDSGHGVGRMGILGNQLQAYTAIFNDLIAATITSVNEGQREINREFVPVITACMDPAYAHCASDKGPGVYKRMKDHMAGHIDREKEGMFNSACEQVRDSLGGLVDQVSRQMLDRVDSVYVNMRGDYLRIIGGVNVQQIQLSREERAVRRDVDEALTLVDLAFQKVVDCDTANLKTMGSLDERDGNREAEAGMDADFGVGDESEPGAESDDDDEEEVDEWGESEAGGAEESDDEL